MADASLVDRFRPGDHVCWTFADDAERDRVARRWVRAGQRDHHKMLCLTDRFDAAAAAEIWRDEISRARRDGYAGLRVLGDMSWAAGGVDGLDEYESQVNRVYADGFAMALCLYDRRLFTPRALAAAGRAHPATITDHSGDTAPLLRMVRRPGGLLVIGEADMSNRDAFAAVLRHLLADTTAPEVTLDLSGLRFADASACRVIAEAGVRVVGARPELSRLLAAVGHTPIG